MLGVTSFLLYTVFVVCEVAIPYCSISSTNAHHTTKQEHKAKINPPYPESSYFHTRCSLVFQLSPFLLTDER